jgi:hypothetical protein
MMHLVRGPEVLLLHSRVRHASPPGEPARWAGSQTKGSSSTGRSCPNGGLAAARPESVAASSRPHASRFIALPRAPAPAGYAARWIGRTTPRWRAPRSRRLGRRGARALVLARRNLAEQAARVKSLPSGVVQAPDRRTVTWPRSVIHSLPSLARRADVDAASHLCRPPLRSHGGRRRLGWNWIELRPNRQLWRRALGAGDVHMCPRGSG